jgi:thiol-disulfide isomerase/thioredoxin
MPVSKRTVFTIAFLLTVVLALSAVTYYIVSYPKVKEDAPARTALQFQSGEGTYTNLTGEEVDLSSHFGKKIVVYSWASWCPQCQDDLPVFNELAKGFDKNEVIFLAINRSENNVVAQRFLHTLPELGTIEIVLDDADHLFKAIDGFAMPEIVVFDEKGETTLHQRGLFDVEEIRQVVSQH